MRTEVIKADSINAAAGRILDELKEGSSIGGGSREHVIYFDGWDGLGASAVLQAVAQRLAAGAPEAQGGLHFDQIIHIDCSRWESMRALQRAIADHLDLPPKVMKMFDRQDEEDDFHGVVQGSRAEIPQVLEAMYQRIKKLNHRFLVIFHNRSSEEMDLSTFGFPLFGYSTNKVLWTFQGRFRLYPRIKTDNAIKATGNKTDVFLSASSHEKDPRELWSFLLHQEAAEVADKISTSSGINQSSQVAECFLYMLRLSCIQHFFGVDYDLATHGCNYWICEGIIQPHQGEGHIVTDDGGGGGGSWRAAGVLQHEMRLDVDYYRQDNQYLPPWHLVMCNEGMPLNWFMPIPAGAIPNYDMFQHFDKDLRVLKLSRRTLCVSSPPFLYCHRLKFLWLDHCQEQEINTDRSGKEDISQCFQRLWVLDVRYTQCDWILSARMLDFMTQLRELNVMGAQGWDIGQLQGRLPNIRKLRVTKSTVSSSENNLILGRNKMELLDFSGNCTMQGIANLSDIGTSGDHLETAVIIDGCAGIQKVSFKGCPKLNNLLVSGLFEDLRILDLSGTAIKTLDLSAITARKLDELFLDECEKLRAILWPPECRRKRYLQKLRIDTTWLGFTGRISEEKSKEPSTSASEEHGAGASREFDWCISVRDTRLLGSLVPINGYFLPHTAHVEISSPGCPAVDFGGTKPEDNPTHTDVRVSFMEHGHQENGEGDAQTMWIYPCPKIPSPRHLKCYIHIQDLQMRIKLQLGVKDTSATTIPDFICDNAAILHVHDSLSITSVPGPAPAQCSGWRNVRWCRVERCPKLDCIFTISQLLGGGEGGQSSSGVLILPYLDTLWASRLLNARYICDRSGPPVTLDLSSFEGLKFLHLSCCPRLIHVLPLSAPTISDHLKCLETLEIVWCGELEEVFPLYTDADNRHQYQQQRSITVEFKNLRQIHLQELPMLQGICGHWRVFAPKLETINIRGCWSLKRLPAVNSGRSRKVECDCEKEWWDKLEWGVLDAQHHPSLYKPTHSRYYRKTMLRGTMLR